MSKLAKIKRVLKQQVMEFPIWGWIACFLLITLLKSQIANMLNILLPIAIITIIIFACMKKKCNVIKVLIFTIYSMLIISLL